MNAVRQRERAKTARHESAHAASEIYFGHIPEEIVINEPADSGYITGWCSGTSRRGQSAVMAAVGVLDAHGSFEDEADLYRYAPDPKQREEILRVAAQIMATAQFVAVQKALRLKLQFRDRLERNEIAEIAAKALRVPPEVLTSLSPDAGLLVAAASASASGVHRGGGKAANAGGEPGRQAGSGSPTRVR